MSILQFLPQAVLESLDFTVTPIIKGVGSFDLQWAEIVDPDGIEFRLPGYTSVLPQFGGVALALEARAVVLDVLFLGAAEDNQPGSGAFLVGLLQSDFSVWSFTVNDEQSWLDLQSLGIDGIFIDNIPLGVTLQAPFDAP